MAGWSKIHHDTNDALASQPGAAVKVYLRLVRHADEKGLAWPSQETIAADTGLSRRSVGLAIKTLELADLVTVEKQRRLGQFERNSYRIHRAQKTTHGSPHRAQKETHDRAQKTTTTVRKKRTTNKNQRTRTNCNANASCNFGLLQHLRAKATSQLGTLEIAHQAAYLVATNQLTEFAFHEAVEASSKPDVKNPGGLFRKAVWDACDVDNGDKQGQQRINRLLSSAKRALKSLPADQPPGASALPTGLLKKADTRGIVDEY